MAAKRAILAYDEERLERTGHRVAISSFVIARRGGRTLLARSRAGDKHYWFVPGEVLRWSEHPDEGALRVLREWFNDRTTKPRYRGVQSHRGRFWALCFIYTAQPKTSDLPPDVPEVRYFPRDRLPRPIGFGHRDVLRAFFEDRWDV